VNPNRVARVAMPIPGRVSQVHVQLGDAVKQGQPLLAIDSPEASEAVAAHRQAQSELRQARSALEKAKNDLSRVQDLYEHRAAPLKDVQQAQNELTQCEAEVEQAQAARDSAVHRLGLLGLKPGEPRPEVTVLAPISGKVIEIAVVRGEYRTDTSANLLTIADLGTVWMAAEVPESSIRLIQVGEAVQVELAAYPGEIRRGRVMRIADMVDPATRTIKVQTELDNPGGRLRPEMFGKIRHSHGACPAPVVPLSAIVHGEGGAYVFIERAPGEFERAPVGMGEVRAGMTQILSGVKQGDRVVVEGSVLLRGHPGGRR
jgi:cobalt-zinc-cadmium efflux system membrane fusion protein